LESMFHLGGSGHHDSGRFRRSVLISIEVSSDRGRRLMSTNSVVIKTTIFTEWYQPHLIPCVVSAAFSHKCVVSLRGCSWFMYIPAKLDFSDLPDIMALSVIRKDRLRR